MLASSVVISGLVICPVNIRDVKISSYLGDIFCDLYSLVLESWRASRDWRWSFGGR